MRSMTATSGETNLIGMISGSVMATTKSIIEIGLTFETVYYAAVGAVVGWLVTELLKFLKRKITKK